MQFVAAILLVFGFVFFVLTGLGTPSANPNPPRNLLAWGLACWILAEILMRGPALIRGGPGL
jgi:hypothetical protein